MIALMLFSKKIKSIAAEKGIEAKKWLLRLFLMWFGIEILTIVLFMVLSQNPSKDIFIMGSIVGILAASISAIYNVNEMKKEDSVI